MELKGSVEYRTTSQDEVITVISGKVNIYVTRFAGGQVLRSAYLCSVGAGVKIPGVYYQGGEEHWGLQLFAAEPAQIEVAKERPEEIQAIREQFVSYLPERKWKSEKLTLQLVAFLEGTVYKEEEVVLRSIDENKKARAQRQQVLLSPFLKAGGLKYHSHSESVTYNTMCVLCDYMKIKICSYQALEATYGPDFDVYDIARMSHFVMRTIALKGKWYLQDGGAFLGYLKEGHVPVLCIPKGIHRYVMYNLAENSSELINRKNVEKIETEGIMLYHSMKGDKLSAKDVLFFGLRSVRTRDAVIILIMAVLSALTGLLLPRFNEMMFDRLIPMADKTAIWEVGLVIFSCSIGNLFFMLVQNLATLRVTKGMEYSIVGATMERLLHMPQHFIEKYGSADLANRVLGVSGVFQMLSTGFITAVLGFGLSVLYVIKMFRESVPLAGRAVFMVLLTALVILAFGYLRLRHEREKIEKATKANAVMYQFLSGIMKVKLSGIEDMALLEYQKENVGSVESDMKSTRLANLAEAFHVMAEIFYPGFIYYTIMHRELSLTIGEYSSFSAAFGLFSASAMQMFNYFLVLGAAIPAYKRVKPVYRQETELHEMAGGVGKIQGNIEADHLVFYYEGEEKPVLNDISFKIGAGDFVGIVGASGCGKSTLLKCLLGFEKPGSGKIYYDNRDIDTLDKRELRRQLGVVLQNGRLCSGTIYSNIELAAPGITPEEVEKLMAEVGMREDIRQMPMGIFTEVSEFGGTISGGQQQRIMIARALANNPTVIFFDEATSALDNVAQERVCENLEGRNITRVMIAHRLSTVKNCDLILVMQEGKIAEQGNYEELIGQKGLFYQLVERQQLSEEKQDEGET